MSRAARPVLTEPLLGWRVWQVIDGRDGPGLPSWWLSIRWPALAPLVAGCGLHGARPVAHHACGIHAFGRREDALAYATERRSRTLLLPRVPERALGIAFGRVSGWGDAVRHTRGWRSQFAYPYDLSLLSGDRGMARALADRYAVETSPLSALG